MWLREFSTRRPRWGWRRAAKTARRAGWKVNDKRVQRLWREEGLKVPYRKRKKPLRGIGTAVGAMCPIAPNALWAMDFQFDTTVDGRTIKLLNIVDEYTRECPAIVVERSIDADRVVATLDRLAVSRGAPAFVRFDNGPEFIAHAVADWCRFNGVGTVLHRPGLPMAERLDRIVQRPAPRRATQRLALRQPARSPSPHRGLENRLQHQQATHGPRRPHPSRVRRHLQHPTPTNPRITPGPVTGGSSEGMTGLEVVEVNVSVDDLYIDSEGDDQVSRVA